MEPKEILHVGVVGARTMGARIAFRCAISGKEVNIFSRSSEHRDQAIEFIRKWFEDRVNDGGLKAKDAQSRLSRVHSCASLAECVAGVELVIKKIPKNLELKRQVFSQIDRLAPAQVLIPTNSSSIPCSRLATATSRPDKIFNINLSDPSDDGDKLVELMKETQTVEETIAIGERFVKSLSMVPIIIKREIMGFAFNRIWRTIKRETLFLRGYGYTDFEDIDRAWMLEFRTPYGQRGLMDRIGLDVVRDIEMQYYRESGDERDKPPQFLEDFVAQGRLGVKSGRGFYAYPNPGYEQPGWLYKEPPWTPGASNGSG